MLYMRDLNVQFFKEKYPQMKIASIGPTIRYPHSIHEECEIASINNVYNVVEKIVTKINTI
jgi:dipeptidase D